MSTLRYIWHNTQPLSLLLRRYIGWVASSLALALFLYIPFNLLPITPNLFNLWLAISILIIQPVLHQLSKKVLRIKVIHINTGELAGPIRSLFRTLLFFIPPFNLIDCLTMFLDGRRISEWATDTKVIPENDSSEELSLLEHKNQSSLITYKRGFLVISIFIFSVFYYQIIFRGISDIKMLDTISDQMIGSNEGMKILNVKGILSLGILGREFDSRNKYQKFVAQLSQTEYDNDRLRELFQKISLKRVPEILTLLENKTAKRNLCNFLIDLEETSDLIGLQYVLKSEDDEIRYLGVEALVRSSIGSRQVVLALIPAVRDQNADIRQYSAQALGKIGSEAKQAVPALIIALNHQDKVVRDTVVKSLVKISPETFRQDTNVRSYATKALEKIGPEAFPALTRGLKVQDVNVRRFSAIALGKIGLEAKDVALALTSALKDQDVNVRSYAAEALGQVAGPVAKQAILVLIQSLKDENKDIRQLAAEALGQMGPDARQAVPALTRALKDHDSHVRGYAAEALGRIGPEAKQSVPALIQLLDDPNEYVRRYAAEALGKLGPEGQQELVRKNTVWVLEEIGLVTKQAVPSLIQGLEDYDSNVHKSVVDEIQKIDSKIEAETTDETSFDF